MPYIEKVTRAGRTVLYERSYSSHIHPPGATRSEKMKDTKESQKKINLRKAITELTILMNANFVPGDYHITLTYERDKRAETVEEAKRDRKIFLDRLRRRMKKEKEICKYGQYADKLFSVIPGVTGYWQAHGRSDTSYDERIEMDMYYIDNKSILLDIKIMFKTVISVIKKEGAV